MSLSLIFDSTLSSPRLNTKTKATISHNHLPSFLNKRNMRHHQKILFIFTTLLILTSSSIARNTLTPTTPLPDNETLISASGSFALGFFNPNPKNQYIGLWYNRIPKRKFVWVANWANPLVNSPGLLSIAPNGTLTITDKNLHVVWSSNTSTKLSNPIAQLLDNGNLVVKELNNDTSNYAWQGFDHPTDTLLAGMIMGVDFATGLNRTLTSWSSPEDPTPGPYNVYIETRGDPEVFLTKDRNRIWRSGPWVGDRFSGVPNMLTYQGINYSLVNNMSGVTYSYQLEPYIISVLSVTSSGSYQRAVWVIDTQEWDYYFSAPKDLCDQIGKCGNYGLCDLNGSPICNCLNGFEPKNRVNWNTLNDWSDGCVRKHELECKNGADEFRLVSNVKLPQSEDCMVDLSLNLDDCKSLCLMNCSCTAYASAVADNSSGCVIWIGVLFDVRTYHNSISGQDLYVRLNAIDVPPINVLPINVPKGSSGSKSHNGVVVPVVVSLVAGILLISCVGCVLCMRKMKKRKLILGAMNSYSKQFEREHRDESIDLPVFDFDTIIAATDYFSYNNKLGEGGFGPVYKGKLGDEEIAVKRLSTTSSQGSEEFKNEVMLIAKLQHVNLVRLLGYCIQGEERVLIYEYLPNRSLDAFLFDKEKRSLLNWNTRYQIITGIARGLLYLHHDSRLRIIHRDLKAGNILLDEDMIPKISDFGMARIFSGNETDFNTRKIVGTYGYMSPEYAMDGAFSIKSDVFSFGVLVLEIISGKKNRVYAKPPHINLLAHAWNLWKEGAGMQLVDDLMGDSFSSDEVLRCIKLGLLCVQEHPQDRPLMSSVIQMFSSDIKMIPQPRQPGFTASRYSQDSCSNERSITMIEPR